MENQGKTVAEKAKLFLSHTGKVSIVFVAMIFGFFIGDIYHRLQATETEKPVINLKNVHIPAEISVAINERNELMVIDRRTGSFEMYSDSVGTMIFNLYAGRIYSQTQPNPVK